MAFAPISSGITTDSDPFFANSSLYFCETFAISMCLFLHWATCGLFAETNRQPGITTINTPPPTQRVSSAATTHQLLETSKWPQHARFSNVISNLGVQFHCKPGIVNIQPQLLGLIRGLLIRWA